MDLFHQNGRANLLPRDGQVEYHGPLMGFAKAETYLNQLLSDIEWHHDEVKMFGKHIVTKRKVAWFADDGFSYSYSNTTKVAQGWTPFLSELREIAEKASGETFNSCLLNLYHSGQEGMGWHSDDEKELVTNGAIASLSFGAERKFSLKHKLDKTTVSQVLETGSLLVMKGATQAHWLHSMPKTTRVSAPRVNLTFRQIAPQS